MSDDVTATTGGRDLSPKSARSVFTIASGSKLYLRFAYNLARSFALHNNVKEIPFYIFTDFRCDPPDDLSYVVTLPLPDEMVGKGVATKLYIDRLSPTPKSLFIDADCLAFRDLGFVFDRFAGHCVSVVGIAVTDGNWSGPSTASLCSQFAIPSMPRFNGGIYYIEKGVAASRIYETARELQSQYDILGFHRHRGWVNEEPLISLAMAIHGESQVTDDGSIMSDLAVGLDNVNIDVLSGLSALYNPPSPSSRNKWWQNPGGYNPAIMHFCGGMAEAYPYKRESLKLALKCGGHVPDAATRALAFVLFSVPHHTLNSLKSLLRPAYKMVFGNRPARPDARPYSQ
jgi:hypothetical protein